MLKAGWSKAVITPEVGARLTGFSAREGVSVGVHDELYARTLVFESEQRTIALVSVEVLALDDGFIAAVKQAVSRRTRIPVSNILIACTHTHAGPVTIEASFNPEETVDAAYMRRLSAAIEQSVDEAWQGREAATAGWGVTQVAGVGVNRRDPQNGYVDKAAGVLKVCDMAGAVRAVLIHYACHPTVLGPDNQLVTGDFPSFALQEVERSTGGFAMFFNGAQGDVSMGHSSELSAIGVIAPGRTFERAAELGQRLAAAVLDEVPRIATAEIALDAASIRVELPLKSYPPAEEMARASRVAVERLATLAGRDAADTELRRAKMDVLYTSIEEILAEANRSCRGGPVPVELQGVRAGEMALIGVPAEAFAEVGQRMKQAGGSKILVVGLANGYLGYVPCRQAYGEGGYEVVSSRFTADAEDVLANAVEGLASSMGMRG